MRRAGGVCICLCPRLGLARCPSSRQSRRSGLESGCGRKRWRGGLGRLRRGQRGWGGFERSGRRSNRVRRLCPCWGNRARKVASWRGRCGEPGRGSVVVPRPCGSRQQRRLLQLRRVCSGLTGLGEGGGARRRGWSGTGRARPSSPLPVRRGGSARHANVGHPRAGARRDVEVARPRVGHDHHRPGSRPGAGVLPGSLPGRGVDVVWPLLPVGEGRPLLGPRVRRGCLRLAGKGRLLHRG